MLVAIHGKGVTPQLEGHVFQHELTPDALVLFELVAQGLEAAGFFQHIFEELEGLFSGGMGPPTEAHQEAPHQQEPEVTPHASQGTKFPERALLRQGH